MKFRLILMALVAFVLPPLSVNAQVMFDTTRVTCANYLAMSPTDARLFSAFMSGWFNQKTGHVTVDLNQYEKNVANVAELVRHESERDRNCRSYACDRHSRQMTPGGV